MKDELPTIFRIPIDDWERKSIEKNRVEQAVLDTHKWIVKIHNKVNGNVLFICEKCSHECWGTDESRPMNYWNEGKILNCQDALVKDIIT